MEATLKESIVTYLKSKQPTLEAVYIFGSHATHQTHAQSDIAFLADHALDPLRIWELKENLAVDLNSDVDLIDLWSASDVLRQQVISTGTVIYAKDSKALIQKEITWMALYLEFNESRQDLLRAIKDRGSVDDVIVNKCASIERCLKRIHSDYHSCT